MTRASPVGDVRWRAQEKAKLQMSESLRRHQEYQKVKIDEATDGITLLDYDSADLLTRLGAQLSTESSTG